MKKSLLLTFAILFSITMMAQNRAIFISESFDNSTMPVGWRIMENGTSNWSVSPSNYAGGTANEMKFEYDPAFNGISRLVTPAVDLSGVSNVVFMFNHYLDNYSGSHTLGIATSSDNGTTWNEAWSEIYSQDGQYTVSQNISTEDIGQPNVMFCIFYSGYSYNMDNWYFDDIQIFTQEDLDISLRSIDIGNIIEAGNVDINFKVFNYGLTPITSIEANYQFEGFDMVTENFDVNIASLESQSLSFEIPQRLDPGTYSLTLNISLVNGEEDDDMSNNTLTKTLSTSLGTTQRIPMIEHFSSSTCGPCVNTNNLMSTLTSNNPGKFTYTKYPMNWPGSGDPYYTNEGEIRRTYYGVSAVPQTFLDGMDQGYTAVSQNAFDQQYNTPAYADIRGAFTVEGSIITITADIMSYVEMNDVRAFVSVNEKTTYDNVGSNGETEFHHIMMKMLPDAQGSTIDINAGEYTRLEFTYDMSTTNVEEMEDLEVSVWLQNYVTKEMYNSHFLYEYTEHPHPVQNLQMAENDDNTMTIHWDAPESGNPIGYNVYLDSELVAENTTELEYTFPSESGIFYVAEVCAIYEDDMTSVRSVVGVLNTLSLEDNMVENHCSIYPNPANNHVNIVNNTEIRSISIFNCVGVLVDRIQVRGNNIELNTSKYDTGVYFMNIVNANGYSSSKKLVITH